MKIKIHRGTHEIGGSCVELESQGKSLILDIGTPLVNPDGSPFEDKYLNKPKHELKKGNVLPSVYGLYDTADCTVAGVILSHSHLDHYGLARYINEEIPVYASKGTKILIEVSNIFLPNSREIKNLVILPERWKPIQIGPFTVTSYPVDHSAPDAIAVKVEANEKKVFYSGDFRGHGRKAKLFEHMLKKPPQNVDVLLMEGSNFGREPQEYSYPDEESVEKKIMEVVKDKENIALMFCSSQNIDRIVTAFKVAKTCGFLVFDLYTAYILHKLKPLSQNLPQYDWDGIRVKFWHHHQKALEQTGNQDFLKKVMGSGHGIKTEEIVKRRKEILFLAKANSLLPKFIRNLNTFDGIKVIWSMWTGYITGNDRFSKFCEEHNFDWHEVHTSGHASIGDLKLFADAIKPKQLIPIHTFYPELYKNNFQNVLELSDGVEITL